METKVTLFVTNDFHRKLHPMKDDTGGAARLVGKLRELHAGHPDSLVLNLGDSTGDNTMPGPDAFAPIADLFDRAGVGIFVPGNHEFEDPTNGYQTLREGLIQPLDAEVLCANVETPLDKTKPYSIRQLAGINLAFIGVVTQELSSAMFPLAGTALKTVGITETLQHFIPQVRQEGADAVIVLAHEGIPEMKEFIAGAPSSELVLAAHDHQYTPVPEAITNADGTTTYISEAGAYGRYINQIDLFFNDDHKLTRVEGTTHKVDASSPSDPVAEEIVRNAPEQKRATAPPKKKWKSVDLSDLAKAHKG